MTAPEPVSPGQSGWELDMELAGRIGRSLAAIDGLSAEPEVAAARVAGHAVRQVIERFNATSAPPEVLAEVTARLREALDLLTPYSAVRTYRGSSEASGLAQDQEFFDWSPVAGLANPLAPPLHMSVEDAKVVGLARFDMSYEGPPGCVHGGYIAASFDEVLGLAQSLSGQVGMTANLTIRYRKPTPLKTELRFEGQVDDVVGRKVFTTGRLLAGDSLLAEASGLFVSISPERFRSLHAQREQG